MNQRGIALLTGLVLLTALSLLALVSANGTVEQRHLAGNFESGRLALEHAALAEISARAWLFSRADIERDAGCVSDCLLPAAVLQAGVLPEHPEFESAAWWQANAHPADANPETGDSVTVGGNGAEPARWLLEEQRYEPAADDSAADEADIRGVAYYRILSRGTGRGDTPVAVTEVLLARPWGERITPAAFPQKAGASEFCNQFGNDRPCGVLAWRKLR